MSATRTYLMSRARTYAAHSSIKCLPKIVHASTLAHRLLWVIAFITGVALGIYLLSGLWITYFSYQITLSLTEEEGGRPPFPDVTVCNLNPLWNNAPGWGILARVEGEDRPLTYDEYIYLLFMNMYQPEANDTVFETTNPELYSVPGYLKHAEYDDSMLESLSNLFIWKCIWKKPNGQSDCVVSPVITPTNGLCYTIRPPAGEGLNVKTRQEGLSVILFLNNLDVRFVADYRISPFQSYTEGVKVILHPRGTVPHMVDGFTIAPGSEANVVAKYYKRRILPEPYGKCEQNLRLDTFSNVNAENVWNYSQYACTSLCYQSRIVEKCGCLDCTEITFDVLTDRYRFCSIFTKTNNELLMEDLNCTRSVKDELDVSGTCNVMCQPPCDWTFYKTSINQVPWPHEIYILALYYTYLRSRSLPEEFQYYYATAVDYVMKGNTTEARDLVRSTNLIQRNFLQLSITMDDTVTTEEDKPAITLETLFGSVGGILNLWIGFTFITVMEFVDFLLSLIVDKFFVAKVCDESENNKQVSRKSDEVSKETLKYSK